VSIAIIYASFLLETTKKAGISNGELATLVDLAVIRKSFQRITAYLQSSKKQGLVQLGKKVSKNFKQYTLAGSPVLQVQAVADRAACGVMAVEGSTLFSEDGAKTVRKHFKNILESLVPLGQDDEESEHEPASPTDVT
ncbi:unnamed protein product, partial [Symbiodinium sp. KB8]